MKAALAELKRLGACGEAVDWVKMQKSPQKAWDNCERGDWMLWYIGKHVSEPESDTRKKLVLCACACARLPLKYIPKDEQRPLAAIETAEKWAKGDADVTTEDVRIATSAAYAAYVDAYVANAANAANVAASAASIAVSAASSVYADSAASTLCYIVFEETLNECAQIVRKFFPKVELIIER